MQKLIEHARCFTGDADLHRLAGGQSPLALFITCSDSRVIPSLFTGARPGELFELRTAGNIVPRYRLDRPSGEAATIEFAVEVLGVADIVVCGHSHCGAVGAMTRGDDLSAVPALREWLATSTPLPGAAPGGEAADAAQRHVLNQTARLLEYPGLRERVAGGRLGLHAWYYRVHTGAVLAHDPGARAFLPL
ncbi:carbonic anhydrase [Actinomadura parmotrematis]|uniref:Carbonic anhydrase n=1 Tax=Actinomadura parmotrematis TaxID=2864039 RepID=A0ABS7FVD2_9ACTN|nr:carbonic anhydrase [Actinomadura parmotrematis]MBW8484385.1 carbonic anhydrase [Actinomadura parmotrematis]